ncbi:hypothetical protein JW777_06665 [bacterium]|nr:hypothetical protein [bacterium]
MPLTCPKCGEFALHRSHTQNAGEHLIKTFSPLRPYRCGACKWRGWRMKERAVNKQRRIRNLVIYGIVFVVAVVFALYMRTLFQ